MKRDLPLKDRGKKPKLGQARKSDSAGENRGLKG